MISVWRTLSLLAPEYILDGKWTTMVDESTLNLTVILHGTTQTRCIILPKVTGNALITLDNISCCSFVPSRLCGTNVASNPTPNSFSTFREKTRPDT